MQDSGSEQQNKALVFSQLSVTDETKESKHDAWLSMTKTHQDRHDGKKNESRRKDVHQENYRKAYPNDLRRGRDQAS